LANYVFKTQVNLAVDKIHITNAQHPTKKFCDSNRPAVGTSAYHT